jgi:glucose-1-phosphate thymidylyltransferase
MNPKVYHAVMIAKEYLNDEPFLMYLGDNLIKQSIQNFVREFEVERPDALILLKEVKDPSMFGVAVIDNEGNIKKLVEKPKEFISNLALVGIYFFSSFIHQVIPELKPSFRGELEITDAIQKILDKKRPVKSHILKDCKNSFIGPYTSIGEYCLVENSALEDCVVLNGTKIKNIIRLRR